MLTASNLGHSYGVRRLFGGVTLQLSAGRRIALVGGNGVGKTTLLEILVGLREPDEGQVHRPRELRIGYLPQDVADVGEGTVLEATVAGAGEVAQVGRRLHHLEHELAQADPASSDHDRLVQDFGQAQSRFEQLGGYALEAEAQRVLAGLGFTTADAERPVAELSGGWRMRVALARLLIGDPDVLVLDEPTNHLDVDSVAWLEQRLVELAGALLFVSHDRDFIDNVANRVVELTNRTATEYVGGFYEFVAEREARFAAQAAAAARQARHIAKTERFVERFRYKASKARQVQSRVKALDKLERIPEPTVEDLKARFQFPKPPRSSRVVAELVGVDAGYDGEPVLRGVTFAVERGQRLALVGPNGAGKTTLLKLLLGDLAPLGGELSLGAGLEVARFDQLQAEKLDDRKTAYEEFASGVPDAPGRNLRTLLGSFGFPGDAADRRVADLSGGERTRLALGKIMVEPANVLVLDEPTNHLDLPSCDVLEDALKVWPGTVLLVTHDRHLIRSVATDLVAVRDGRATYHHGVDEALLRPPSVGPTLPGRASPHTEPSAGGSGGSGDADRSRRDRQARKRSQAEQRNAHHQATKDLRQQVRSAERRWERAERRIAELQARLADPAVYQDPERLKELVAEHDDAKDTAADAMTRWERLATKLEEIETGG